MAHYLLDTNVLRGIRDKNANVLKWLTTVNDNRLWISVFTVFESAKGISRALKDNGHDFDLNAANEALGVFQNQFESRIAPLNAAAAARWGSAVGWQEKHVNDKAMVAIAQSLEMTLVTRNVDHMAGQGVHVVNPFKDPAEHFEPNGTLRGS